MLAGTVGERRDADWYAIPAQKQDTAILIKPASRRPLALSETPAGKSLVEWDDAAAEYRGVVPAGKTTYLEIRAAPRRTASR